jgi:hypothetical protein
MNHSPTPWFIGEDHFIITDADESGRTTIADTRVFDDPEFDALMTANAERIVACVNACTGIETEHLTAMTWRLAPVAGAQPKDVAELILKMNRYQKALRMIAIGSYGNLEDFANKALKD